MQDVAIVNADQTSHRLGYRAQDAEVTVAEALEQYFRSIPNLLDVDELGDGARDLFTKHDIAHVVFGCDTSLRQEIMMDVWTVFGTDVGLLAYARYLKTPEAQNLLAEIGYVRAIGAFVRTLPDIARVIVHARRMKKKWPWASHAAYMGRPLRDVRRELGLEIVP
ncbi:MAG TPA: hypothetical protein VL400_03795 [Polyangiaceae bacterium]|nr:hypothetical protein [Polyangiaceae bacterium]